MFRTPYSKNAVVRVVTLAGILQAGDMLHAQPCMPSARQDSEVALVPSFLNAWIARYPTSTLPARMDALTGRDCNVCHHPPNLNTPGNCYREDLAELINLGMPIEDAINQIDPVDSDGDGVSNGDEILAARSEPGEIGFNPGLIGETGTDPCGTNPASVVTGVPETPPLPVPAVSVWGIVASALLLVIAGSVLLRRRNFA